jgi:hypothetical protein
MFLQTSAAASLMTRSLMLQPVSTRLERFGEFVEKEAAQSEREDEKEKSAADKDEVFEVIGDGGGES